MIRSTAVRTYYDRELMPTLSANFQFEDIESIATANFGNVGCGAGQCNKLQVYIVGGAEGVLDIRAECSFCDPIMEVAINLCCEWSRGRSFVDVLKTGDSSSVPGVLIAQVEDGGGTDDLASMIERVLWVVRQAVRTHCGMPTEAPLSTTPAVYG